MEGLVSFITGGENSSAEAAEEAQRKAQESTDKLVALQEESAKTAKEEAAALDAQLAARKRARRGASGRTMLLTGDELGVAEETNKGTTLG